MQCFHVSPAFVGRTEKAACVYFGGCYIIENSPMYIEEHTFPRRVTDISCFRAIYCRTAVSKSSIQPQCSLEYGRMTRGVGRGQTRSLLLWMQYASVYSRVASDN